MTKEADEARPLSELRPGQKGRVLRIDTNDGRRLEQLSSLGIVPDAVLRLVQKAMAAVVQVGETEVAIDPGIARQIYVQILHRRLLPERHGGRRRRRGRGRWFGRRLRLRFGRRWGSQPGDEESKGGMAAG